MASFWNTPAITSLLGRGTLAIDLDTDTIKIGLSTTVHVPGKADTFLDDGSADDFSSGELSGTGYTGGFAGAGRKTLANKTVASVAGDRSQFDADDPTDWLAVYSVTIAQATIFKEITNDAGSPVIANLDFPDVNPNTNDFAVVFHADGIGYIAT